ncbi:amylo-alpha-1,6-glucosidase [Microvirga lotononidis]|uniref:Glycogen debranching enzyme n=1 Tax=Microvirga lotononidis TaxID=864069 RepID=I4YXH6_9HYPH|nr:trehalase family glycosidase [Microvirga lotononidis]EIM28668.1 glycogen debranching enzyme [Microvirga lotononidis]WQO25591.1 trehalase family glycosidase [Microvirga lotononidis]
MLDQGSSVTRENAQRVLRDNDRGGYTVPTARLYPYQWLWDSGFSALGWQTFNEPRAWEELRRLATGQWPDGMIPHIIFHKVDPNYSPGPGAWGTSHQPPTSGISQPPVLATHLRWMLECTCDQALAEKTARELYPVLVRAHRWWRAARDPERTGLVAIYHPWESGMDNSAMWDTPMANVPTDILDPYERRDTAYIAVDQRPQKSDYDRYMALVTRFKRAGWDPEVLWAETPFKVLDPTTNCVLHRADRDLLALSDQLGIENDRAEIEGWIARGRTAFSRLWSETQGCYVPLDMLTGEKIEIGTSGGMLGFYAGVADDAQAKRMVQALEEWGRAVRYLVPSTSPLDLRFEPRRYWRGPVWPNVNWMIGVGLAEYGFSDLARRVREDLRSLIQSSGFYEYWEPTTSEGLGGAHFSWTAATWLAWIDR